MCYKYYIILRCWLSESCCRRSSLSCAVSASNLYCWLSESCCRRSSLSRAVSASNLRCWLSESCCRRSSLNCVDNSSRLALSLCLRLLQRSSLSSAVSDARCCHSRSLLWRKLSSNDCPLRLDPAIGERGRSSLSMVDSWIITLLKTMKSLLY